MEIRGGDSTNKLLDKAVLFSLCALSFAQGEHSQLMVVTPLLALTLSCAASLLPARWPLAALGAFISLCFRDGALLLFAPLIVYDALSLQERPAALLLLLPWVYHYDAAHIFPYLIPVCLSPAAALLFRRTTRYESANAALYALADQMRESDLLHTQKNRLLLEKQDYEIHLATLSERNRIARDIHDNVGHMLSRALLQTGALLYAPGLDEESRAGLLQLKETLSGAMDDVRQSVHNLYAESVDLHAHLRALADGFALCPVQLVYDVDDVQSPAVKYCLLAIAKEALSNVAKHADSPTRVTLQVREHPALYQLTVRDDGRSQNTADASLGLGLRSIEERVAALDGNVHFSHDGGFQIFVSIPKQSMEGSPA